MTIWRQKIKPIRILLIQKIKPIRILLIQKKTFDGQKIKF